MAFLIIIIIYSATFKDNQHLIMVCVLIVQLIEHPKIFQIIILFIFHFTLFNQLAINYLNFIYFFFP